MKDSLWSVDLFCCESILLRSHWVMVVMDVFTRRIIGFGVERADLCGASICRMFNQIIAGNPRHITVNRAPPETAPVKSEAAGGGGLKGQTLQAQSREETMEN